MRSWLGDEGRELIVPLHKPLRVFPRRRLLTGHRHFALSGVLLGAALSAFVICGAQWLYNHDPQWAFASLAALLATPIPWVLAEVD